MNYNYRFTVNSAILVILLLSSISVESEDNWWEYVFYEELEVGDEIKWKIESLSYDDQWIESLNINESEGDVLTLEILHHPNDVVVTTEEYNPDPESIPSYYFKELPYDTHLNNEKINGGLYFIPDKENYTCLIAPYYFRNNTHEFNIFYQNYSDWSDCVNHQILTGVVISSYLHYNYRCDYSKWMRSYATLDDNSCYNFTYIEDYWYNYQFYGIGINRTFGGIDSISLSYDANTGILLEYILYRDSIQIIFYEDYIDFDITNSTLNFLLKHIGKTSVIDYYWILPMSVTTLSLLVILRRKVRNANLRPKKYDC